jgi:hypothetical protein
LARQEGLAEGIKKGIARERELLFKLLRLKFGPLPESTAHRVREATPAEIEVWAERALISASIEAVLGS